MHPECQTRHKIDFVKKRETGEKRCATIPSGPGLMANLIWGTWHKAVLSFPCTFIQRGHCKAVVQIKELHTACRKGLRKHSFSPNKNKERKRELSVMSPCFPDSFLARPYFLIKSLPLLQPPSETARRHINSELVSWRLICCAWAYL